MKRTLALIAILFISTLVKAQQGRQKERISLDEVSINEIGNTSFYINKIIDNRFQKEGIGVVQKKMSNIRVIADFSIPFEVELLQYISKIVVPSDSKKPLTLRVNDLTITEETKAFNENGYAFIYLDIFQKNNDSHTYLGSYSANIKNDTYAVDVTHKHDDRIAKALRYCLEQFNNDFNSKEILDISIDLNSKKIGEFKDLKVGFYNTYFELAQNIVLKTDGFQIVENKERDFTEKMFITDESGNHCKYFAYYDGNNFYLNATIYSNKKYFVKTHRVDNLLFFNERMINNPLLGKSNLSYNTKRDAYFFDMENAWFYMVTRKNLKPLMSKKYKKLFSNYKRRGSKDIYTVVECMEALFKNEDPSMVKEKLRS